MTLGLADYSPWLVWLFPMISSLFVPLIARFGSKVRDSFVIIVGTVTLTLAASMVLGTHQDNLESQIRINWIPIADIELGVLLDPLSILFTILVAFIGLVVLIYSLSYMSHEEDLSRYYFFMLFFIGSMIGLVMADNFLQMFIFWELVGLCSYALVSFWYKRPEAVKAGMKVFLMTKVGDIALLAGILLIYADLHVLSFKQVFKQSGTIAMPTLTIISFLTLFGATVKSAQLPLHTWLYSAMEAPTSVSCLLHGATMVKGGVYLIARTHIMFCIIPVWLNAVAWIGAITALIGATLALHTPDIKGVPAYSTVSQIGFIIAALGTASSPIELGWFASLFHMVSHAFFQGLGFLVIGSIVHQLGTRDMRNMGGLRRDMPITFALCIIVILSCSGVPPFCGFFSKGLVISSLLSTGNVVLILLIYSAAAITFAYSYRFLALTFTGEKTAYLNKIQVCEAPRLMSASAFVLAAGCIILGFLGEPLVNFLGTNFVFDLQKFFNLESLTFMTTLLIGGLPIYLIYQRKILPREKLRGGGLAYIDRTLEKGYFFDDVYARIVGGFINVSNVINKVVETKVLERVPYFIAGNIKRFALGLHDVVDVKILGILPDYIAAGSMKLSVVTLKHFDGTLDKLIRVASDTALSRSTRIRRISSTALPGYVLAVVLGLLFMCVLLLIYV